MMEIPFIFGSFARRRQSQVESESLIGATAQSKRIPHQRSKSTPLAADKTSSARPKSITNVNASSNDSKFKCPFCQKNFVDPRVLPCFHSFCLKCLEALVVDCDDEDQEDSNKEEFKNEHARKQSLCSGYASDKRSSTLYSGINQRITCPTCNLETTAPPGGIHSYPPNYIRLHQMMLATVNSDQIELLCDQCTSEVPATARCMECTINVCQACKETHLKDKKNCKHDVLSLDKARKKGITKLKKRVMCLIHENFKLALFCNSCQQVVCQECTRTSHQTHPCTEISRAVQSHIKPLRLAAEKSKFIAEQSALSANQLHSTAKSIDTQCQQIQQQIEKFIAAYMDAIKSHSADLLQQLAIRRTEKFDEIERCRSALHQRVRAARDVSFFLDELLSEGVDAEIMTFYRSVLAKIEECGAERMEVGTMESLQFLPSEVALEQGVCPVYGVITAQTVSPGHCTIIADGLTNLRVGKKVNVLLETRDRNNIKLERGGEEINAELHHREAASRSQLVEVEDCRNGTYLISFVPDIVGKLYLSITIRNRSIKNSPFPITIRRLKPHPGTFHCCTFCSSGGSKDACCGCDGKMPGGYKGCGHGHEGHPGRRHWSCCGNILEHSECNRLNALYQCTL